MLKRFLLSANATRLTFVLSLGLLFAGSVWAQGTGRITGTVREKGTGDLLIGANLIFQGTAIGSVTDLRGQFTINGAPAGRRVLVVSYIGYRTLELEVTVVAGDLRQLTIEMEWMGVVGEDVVITAQARGQLNAINQQL